MKPKFSLKEISNIAKEISKDLDDNLDDIYTSDKEQFDIAIAILIMTLVDMENI